MEEMGLIDELDAILAMYQFKSTRYVPVAGWRHIITLIGKAYADGMPLPGEEGRGKAVACWDLLTDEPVMSGYFLKRKVGEMLSRLDKEFDFIALSPSGIPVERKEEEE